MAYTLNDSSKTLRPSQQLPLPHPQIGGARTICGRCPHRGFLIEGSTVDSDLHSELRCRPVPSSPIEGSAAIEHQAPPHRHSLVAIAPHLARGTTQPPPLPLPCSLSVAQLCLTAAAPTRASPAVQPCPTTAAASTSAPPATLVLSANGMGEGERTPPKRGLSGGDWILRDLLPNLLEL
jgi:hypothetical protein